MLFCVLLSHFCSAKMNFVNATDFIWFVTYSSWFYVIENLKAHSVRPHKENKVINHILNDVKWKKKMHELLWGLCLGVRLDCWFTKHAGKKTQNVFSFQRAKMKNKRKINCKLHNGSICCTELLNYCRLHIFLF